MGLAFWLGIAFELDWIFPQYLQGVWGDLLGNGMTVGGLTVIALSQFVELTGPRPRRLKTELTRESHSRVDAFLSDFAARGKRPEEMADRLRAVGEEMLLTLTRGDEGRAKVGRHLLLVARDDGDAVDLEFAATTDDANLEDQLAVLSEQVGGSSVEEENLPAAATPLRVVRPSPAVPRHGRGHGLRRTGRVRVRISPPSDSRAQVVVPARAATIGRWRSRPRRQAAAGSKRRGNARGVHTCPSSVRSAGAPFCAVPA